MKYLAPLLALAFTLSSGCANIKAKRHAIFCVGACIHVEGEAEKKGGEPPKQPAPEVTPTAP